MGKSRNYWKAKSTSAIKSKSYLKKQDSRYGIPKKQSKLEEWFKKEEEKIRNKNNW